MDMRFDAMGEGVEGFRVDVRDCPATVYGEGITVTMSYWIHIPRGRAFQPEVNIDLTPEQAVELYDKLGQYILDSELKKAE